MIRTVVLVAAAVSSMTAVADDPLGFKRLRAQVGASLANGSGVAVGQVEPPSVLIDEDPESTRRSHVPQVSAAFDGVEFHNVAPDTPRGSRHASATARRFYGRSQSMAPGVADVHLYTANEFLRGLASAASWPQARVWNHSWVGASGAADKRLLRAMDRAVERNDWVVAVGVANRGPNKPLLAAAFNVLSVGRSDGGHSSGIPGTDSLYNDQRHRPHLVAPAARTSAATPQVASAAVLLLDTLPAALARSSVVRAALMAGAKRRFDRGADPATRAQPDYRADRSVRTANGLDTRFGAGQLNVFNSYQIVTGPRIRSLEVDAKASPIAASGFDYDGRFGADAPDRARYRIKALKDQTLTAALIWDARGGTSRQIADLDLRLLDVTDERRTQEESTAANDTGEHVRASLIKGHDYELVVTIARGKATRAIPYALAWRLNEP